MRILIADDSNRVRQGIRAILGNEADLQVCGDAVDGKQTLELTRELRPDVVLLDIHMPGSDGFQIARQLRLESPEIKVFIMSHDDAAVVFPTASQSGAADCIDKTYLATELVPRLRRLLGPNASPTK
jgi:DNA-binding NarL/FixJ family response regulator